MRWSRRSRPKRATAANVRRAVRRHLHARTARCSISGLPSTTGRGFEFTPILKPLEPFRDQLCVVSGLDGPLDRPAGGGHAIGAGDVAHAASRRRRPRAPTSMPAPRSTRCSPSRSARTRRCRRSSWRTEDFTGFVGACDIGYSCTYMNTHLVAGADHAAADGDQPARRVRADVRRRRHPRPSASRACETDRSILDSVAEDVGAARARPRRARPRAGSATTWSTSAKSSGGSSGPSGTATRRLAVPDGAGRRPGRVRRTCRR